MLLCVVRYRSLRRADHSSRGVIPTVARRVCDLENLVSEKAIAHVELQRHVKKNCDIQGFTTVQSALCVPTFL
jgi:hypothetical protein